MKFGLYLLNNMVSEWRKFYINYHKLKKLLKAFKKNFLYITHKTIKESKLTNKSFQMKEFRVSFIETKSRKESILIPENPKFQISLNKKKITFYRQLCIELYKVNFFFEKNMNYYKNKLQKIENHLSIISKFEGLNYLKIKYEDAIKELYKEMDYMNKFLDLNLQAKRKILKKFNKYINNQENKENKENKKPKPISEQDVEIKKMLEYIETTIVFEDLGKISNIESDIEKIFKTYFYDKYSFDAVKILKESKAEVSFTQSHAFYFGFFIGILLIIFILCILIGNHFHIDMDDDAKFKTIFPMFRGYLIMVFYYWFLGLNVYVWNTFHINYRLAFNFDSHYSDVISICKRAAFFTMIVAIMLLCYMIERTKIPILYDTVSFIPLEFTPLISYIIALIYIFTPFKKFNYQGRIYLGNLFVETMASITTTSELRHTWLGDQMTSLVGPFRDIEYSVCYYTHYYNTFEEKKRLCSARRPIVILIGLYPYFIRFLQVIKTMWEKNIIFPDILNAIKYILSMLVAISSYYSTTIDIFGKTYILIAFFSSCWSYCWDMKMDYGLIQKGSVNPFLRNDLFYKRRWVYYTAMILNAMGRFAWVLTISPDVVYRFIRPEFFLMVIYMVEMCRRGMWNFFRIELKHIDLCQHFQVSDKIKLPKTSEIKELIEKLDKKDKKEGVRKGEKKLSLNMSLNSKRFSIGEDSNLKIFNKFLNDYDKKESEIENNETDYFKLIPKNDK